MRKTILVPTDFSNNAYSAAIYAAHIAQKNGWNLHIYHNYTAQSSAFSPNEMTEEIKNSDLLKADLSIQEFKAKIQAQFPELEIQANCDNGLLVERIPQLVKQDSYALVVMGTKGATADRTAFIGSNTYAITQNSVIPVLAIPLGHEVPALKTAALLSNFKEEELTVLREFTGVFNQNYELKLLHVKHEEEDKDEVESNLDIWKYAIEKRYNFEDVDIEINSIQKRIKELDSIPEVINEMILEEEVDILLVTKTRKSFFNRIFNRSVSKAIALNLIVPTFFAKV